jgi:hypothetical protein
MYIWKKWEVVSDTVLRSLVRAFPLSLCLDLPLLPIVPFQCP